MHLIGYDIGTSSIKVCILEAESGKTVASAQYPENEAPIKALQPGWAEQNPADWWDSLVCATKLALDKSAIDPASIGAIGISYQMHGLVMIDREGNLLRDSIIWCDSRGVPYGEKAYDALGADAIMPRILNRPGNFTATKLAWVKEHEPHIFERIWKVMLPGDYIAWKMTGEICTNPEGLSEYMLWDFRDNAPASFLRDWFGFSTDILPEVRESFGSQGLLTPQAAAQLGLKPGTPVTYRAGDQPNNALSLNVFEPGEIASTAGTSGVVYGINDSVAYDPLSRVNNFAHVNHRADAPRIGVMTCISGTGILNSWLRRNVGAGLSYNEMNERAATAPVGSAGVSILPFGNGAERILENRNPGCSIHGVNFNIHDRSHILRAAQEGIVFSFMYGIEVMKELGMKVEAIHAGYANMFLSPIFRKTLANVTGAEIRLFDTDGAAGAARGAGLGAGFYTSPQEAFASLKQIETILPDADTEPYLNAYRNWKQYL